MIILLNGLQVTLAMKCCLFVRLTKVKLVKKGERVFILQLNQLLVTLDWSIRKFQFPQLKGKFNNLARRSEQIRHRKNHTKAAVGEGDSPGTTTAGLGDMTNLLLSLMQRKE